MPEFDSISALAHAAIDAIKNKAFIEAIAYLGEIKGFCEVYLSEANKWDLIRESYEEGTPPRRIAILYNVTAKQICDKAHYNSWVSPQKLKRHQLPTKGKTIVLDCFQCAMKFETTSGKAKICPTCKAANREKAS